MTSLEIPTDQNDSSNCYDEFIKTAVWYKLHVKVLSL